MSTSGKAGSQSQVLIGQYRIGENIGEGTFGKVKLGVHVQTGVRVAVKTLQKEKIVEQADIERVTREICILKILRHPNIIQLYEIIETKTDIHLIMEYAEGGELFDHIVKSKRLSEAEAVGFMQQILSGVEYIHKNGIVHRDLKPQNLLLDQNKNIKIVDFGLSNQYKPGERLKTACGSPCYAAPEMIAGKRYECIGVDVWSCGIILYAMLCGFLPFEDPNTNKLYKKIMAGDFETPKVLSPQSRDMLRAILDVNPDTRYSIDRIRETKWYRGAGKNYASHGIIVGKDAIEVDDRLLRIMQKHGLDPSQIRNYVTNNRHNHITAFYYLLKKKAERDPSILEEEPAPVVEKRNDSPLIYRPEPRKEYYIPQKKISVSDSNNKDTSRRDDSFNASNIVSSLLEANKSKYASNPNGSLPNRLIKKQDPAAFKLEEFKLFPKKKNSSIYEQSTSNSKSAMTSRSETEELSSPTTAPHSSITPHNRPSFAPSDKGPESALTQSTQLYREEEGSINKKRQELSDQLRQISQKIDKEIIELRKQNNVGANLTDSVRKRESFGPNASTPLNPSYPAQRNKTQEGPFNQQAPSAGNSRETLTSFKEMRDSMNNTAKLSQLKEPALRYPKIHIGPFNSQCLFCEPAKSLVGRIGECLGKLSLKHLEVDPFTIQLSEAESISVMSLQGLSGYFLVSFSANSPLNDSIIDHLNK